MTVSLFIDVACKTGESPVYDAKTKRFYFVDIPNQLFFSYDLTTEALKPFQLPSAITSIALTDAPDFLRVTSEHGFGTFDVKEGHLSLETQLTMPDSDRMNDGKLDSIGQYVAGSINEEDGETASLYRLRKDGSIDVLLEGLTNSNGLVWSEDERTLYHIDTPTKKVYAFDYAPDQPLTNRRVAIDLEGEDGFPDGMTKDREGHVFIAHYAGSCITRWNLETGEKLAHVPFPVSNPTCPIAYEDRLLVTTAADGDESEHAGAVFEVTY